MKHEEISEDESIYEGYRCGERKGTPAFVVESAFILYVRAWSDK